MSRRTLIRSIALVAGALLTVLAAFWPPASGYGQQLGEGMVRTGTVGIQNENERKLFFSLLCTCGCPRESLGTCTCAFAHNRRDELRVQLEAGRSMEQIHADYVERFGTQALAVPPNTGARRILWVLPLSAILFMAAVVVVTLRRWKHRSDQRQVESTTSETPGESARDAYDERLDDELKNLE